MKLQFIRKRPAPLAGADRTIQLEELRTVLPATDVLLIALALTNETENLIGANELKLLPESAVIVNVARGKHIVTEDLVEALRNNEIAGAAP